MYAVCIIEKNGSRTIDAIFSDIGDAEHHVQQLRRLVFQLKDPDSEIRIMEIQIDSYRIKELERIEMIEYYSDGCAF